MNIGVIVQATDACSRFPRQAMHALAGKPTVDYLLQSLQQCDQLNGIVVAATHRPEDDRLERHCRRLGVPCLRGSLRNVVGRLREALLLRDWDAFARVDASSPLLDHRLVDHAVGIARRVHCDLVTNIFPGTFPHGQTVEVISREALLDGYSQMHRRDDLLQVTPYFYTRPDEFKIVNFTSKENYSDVRLAVETPADIPRIEALLAGKTRPTWQYSLKKWVRACRALENPSIHKAA